MPALWPRPGRPAVVHSSSCGTGNGVAAATSDAVLPRKGQADHPEGVIPKGRYVGVVTDHHDGCWSGPHAADGYTTAVPHLRLVTQAMPSRRHTPVSHSRSVRTHPSRWGDWSCVSTSCGSSSVRRWRRSGSYPTRYRANGRSWNASGTVSLQSQSATFWPGTESRHWRTERSQGHPGAGSSAKRKRCDAVAVPVRPCPGPRAAPVGRMPRCCVPRH
jgi:hypothetical protein